MSSSAAGAGAEFVEGWIVAQVLGEGAYGEVRLLVNSRSGECVALKALRVRGECEARAAAREAALHRTLRHPHILRCLGERLHPPTHYIFLEYAAGGELFDKIEPDLGVGEAVARGYWRQLLSGVRYLHMRGVTHRDIKPENLLLDARDSIKISDFGMATIFRHGGVERLLMRKCGTLPYAAPEVLAVEEGEHHANTHTLAQHGYRAQPADVWSCAIVLITMLAGELPWESATPNCARYSVWCSGDADCRPWCAVPGGALSMLRTILVTDARRRPTVQQLISHAWSEGNDITKTTSAIRGWVSQPGRSDGGVGVGGGADGVVDLSVGAMDALISFSQPAIGDDVPVTQTLTQQSTQSDSHTIGGALSHLAKRMTRVRVKGDMDEVGALDALCSALKETEFSWRRHNNIIVSIQCPEGVVIRAWATRDEKGHLMIEMRRWKGCGLQFKRHYRTIREHLRLRYVTSE